MATILSPHGLYGGNRKSKIQGYKPLKGGFGSLQIFSIRRMPGDRTLLSLDASMQSRCVSSASKSPDCVVAHRSDRDPHLSDRYPLVRLVRPTGQTSLELLQHRLRFSGLGFVDQPRNLVVFW
jgi:hypothetical protein